MVRFMSHGASSMHGDCTDLVAGVLSQDAKEARHGDVSAAM